ncbi:uncharacterized protein EV420DRAFT_1480950 [Desarmillaria tabescens]|uniref:Uncharacterized protein n=1 Tax=Armillaria tabescens TaxID=1929756 RepID=A0AA39KC15_ARMTA|nr:uncharacterized protein EV420DRAFT_1480950 [Desarmillaria tabescens]KAK0457076.1 hypothetical protein EV420DRAFT_1480950 [Desarmillaria tabescens]
MAHTIPFCVVLAPPGVPGAEPGIYNNKLVWIVNGVNGPKWLVAVYSLHGTEDLASFRSSLRGWEDWPGITALFNQNGTTFWSVIFGARSGIFYQEAHATEQMERSLPQYRAAFGFDRFENALICQMSRSSNIVGLLDRLPRPHIAPPCPHLNQPSVPSPDVPSPGISGGSLSQKQKQSNADISHSKMPTSHGSPSKSSHLTSTVHITNSGNNEVFSTTTHRNVHDIVHQGPIRQASPQKMSRASLRLPRLLRLYLDIYQYPEVLISQYLDMAEDRDDFVEAMSFNGVPEEAGGFIWDLYLGLLGF